MKTKKNNQGQLSLELILFSTMAVILISGFVSLAASFVQLSVRSLNKLQAFAIAESGIEYYRWHLAHAPADYEDGTGHAGPYTHNYFDKDGRFLGSFTLTITPPPSGSTVVTIQSAGKVLADSSIEKIIKVQLGKQSFAKFAVLADDVMRFGTGTEIFGPIFSNNGIRFDGLAHNIVESAVESYDDPDHSGPDEFGVHTHVPPVDPLPPAAVPSRPDVFMAGRNFPVPAADFTQITQTLSSLKSLAQASGTYFASSSAYGYDLALATSGIYSMYKVTALAQLPNGCTNMSNQPDWGVWSVGAETLVATGTIPQGGVVFVEDDVWVRGQVNGKRLTIGAGRFPDNESTRANITINSSTLYTNYNGSDTLAFIAQNNFNVGLFSEDILRIDGAIVAQNGRVGRFYYAPPNLQSQTEKCGDTVFRQEITLYGSINSNERYGFGYTDSTGYQERNIIYDSNLLYNPPPNFPLTTDQYSPVSWTEIQ